MAWNGCVTTGMACAALMTIPRAGRVSGFFRDAVSLFIFANLGIEFANTPDRVSDLGLTAIFCGLGHSKCGGSPDVRPIEPDMDH